MRFLSACLPAESFFVPQDLGITFFRNVGELLQVNVKINIHQLSHQDTWHNLVLKRSNPLN
jgi:hypothetical protein